MPGPDRRAARRHPVLAPRALAGSGRVLRGRSGSAPARPAGKLAASARGSTLGRDAPGAGGADAGHALRPRPPRMAAPRHLLRGFGRGIFPSIDPARADAQREPGAGPVRAPDRRQADACGDPESLRRRLRPGDGRAGGRGVRGQGRGPPDHRAAPAPRRDDRRGRHARRPHGQRASGARALPVREGRSRRPRRGGRPEASPDPIERPLARPFPR